MLRVLQTCLPRVHVQYATPARVPCAMVACVRMSTAAEVAASKKLPAALLPAKLNGHWRGAVLGGRRAAELRKKALLAEVQERMSANTSGDAASTGDAAVVRPVWRGEPVRWSAAWERLRVAQVRRAPKGARHELRVNERLDKIAAALAGQEKRIAEYKKTLPPKARSAGLLQYIKKQAWEKD